MALFHAQVREALAKHASAHGALRDSTLAVLAACDALAGDDSPEPFRAVGNAKVKWRASTDAREMACRAARAALDAIQYYFDEYEPTRRHDGEEEPRIVALRKAMRDLQNDHKMVCG